MPKQKIKQLIGTLNDYFGDASPSPEQQALLEKVQQYTHENDEPDLTDPSFKETLLLLAEEIEEDHPTAAGITRDILNVLTSIGI